MGEGRWNEILRAEVGLCRVSWGSKEKVKGYLLYYCTLLLGWVQSSTAVSSL